MKSKIIYIIVNISRNDSSNPNNHAWKRIKELKKSFIINDSLK